jgi:hypothetical protein
MAIDTQQKRADFFSYCRPFHPSVVFPDGTISQGDRQTFLKNYSGIAFAPPPAVVISEIITATINRTARITATINRTSVITNTVDRTDVISFTTRFKS